MRHTQHSRAQQQRRGIDDDQLGLVLEYGDEFKATDHAAMYRISRKELLYLANDCPPPLWRRYRDSLNRTVPVISNSGVVLTTMQRYRKIWRSK